MLHIYSTICTKCFLANFVIVLVDSSMRLRMFFTCSKINRSFFNMDPFVPLHNFVCIQMFFNAIVFQVLIMNLSIMFITIVLFTLNAIFDSNLVVTSWVVAIGFINLNLKLLRSLYFALDNVT